jgi:DNA-binding phage protein
MGLSNKQIELLKGIQNRLQRGDIKEIATRVEMTREHVSRALNISGENYSEKIIDAAMQVITEREERVTQYLQTLAAAE